MAEHGRIVQNLTFWGTGRSKELEVVDSFRSLREKLFDGTPAVRFPHSS